MGRPTWTEPQAFLRLRLALAVALPSLQVDPFEHHAPMTPGGDYSSGIEWFRIVLERTEVRLVVLGKGPPARTPRIQLPFERVRVRACSSSVIVRPSPKSIATASAPLGPASSRAPVSESPLPLSINRFEGSFGPAPHPGRAQHNVATASWTAGRVRVLPARDVLVGLGSIESIASSLAFGAEKTATGRMNFVPRDPGGGSWNTLLRYGGATHVQ